MVDALAYIRGALKGVTCVQVEKLAALYLRFEKSLDFPVAKVRWQFNIAASYSLILISRVKPSN